MGFGIFSSFSFVKGVSFCVCCGKGKDYIYLPCKHLLCKRFACYVYQHTYIHTVMLTNK